MAQKIKLDTAAKSFINKKTSKSQNTKTLNSQKEQQTIYLAPEIRRLAKVRAAESGESISDLIERVLKDYLNNTKK